MKAPSDEITKFCDFIIAYKDKGAAYIAQKLQGDEDYAWKIDAIQNHKNIKSAEIERRASNDIADIHAGYQQKRDEIHEKYQEKINQLASSRTHSHYTLDYCGRPGENSDSVSAKITVNSFDQFLEVEPHHLPTIQIPFINIKGSYITTDREISPDDLKNEYVYYLHITCVQNGKDSEIVFSRRQKQNNTNDPIQQLNYAMQHIQVKIDEHDARNARYDERAQQLAEEREALLAKRDGQIQQMRELLHGEPAGSVRQNETPAPSQNGSAADEIKKFKELLDQGIITQEEFDAKKKQLLNL